MKFSAYLIGLLVMLLIAVTFTLQNTLLIEVGFLRWKYESSVAMVIFLAFSFGILFSTLLLTPLIISKQRKVRNLESQLEKHDRNEELIN